jgi:pimeloyl-ACP methyl ester carboxylesterase
MGKFGESLQDFLTWFAAEHKKLNPLDNEQSRLLLASLAYSCGSSYNWNAKTFRSEMSDKGIKTCWAFERRKGAFSWRLAALVWTPVSYMLLLFSFFFVLTIMLALVPTVAWAWVGSWIVALWTLLVWMLTAVSAAVAAWLPAIVEPLAVIGGAVVWLWDVLVEVITPLLFWLPANVEIWLESHISSSFQLFLHELRFVFGLASIFGVFVAAVLLFFPSQASARAFGFVDPGPNSVTLIFCGSTFRDNFLINACVWLHPGPLRHFGFHRAWDHIKPEVEEWLARALPKEGEIILAGHSLGGALAEIAAYDLCDQYNIKAVVAFGSSRIGGPQMRLNYKKRRDHRGESLQQRTWHITHATDGIPRLPPTAAFKHVGEGYLLSPDAGLWPIKDSYLQGVRQMQREADLKSVANMTFPWRMAAKLVEFSRYIANTLTYYYFMLPRGVKQDHNVRIYYDALDKGAKRFVSPPWETTPDPQTSEPAEPLTSRSKADPSPERP